MHYITLPIVSKAVEGLPEIQAKHDGVCKGCAKGKNTKKTFPSSPMSSNSLSGYAYYVSFIDDFSRKTWTLFYEEQR